MSRYLNNRDDDGDSYETYRRGGRHGKSETSLDQREHDECSQRQHRPNPHGEIYQQSGALCMGYKIDLMSDLFVYQDQHKLLFYLANYNRYMADKTGVISPGTAMLCL